MYWKREESLMSLLNVDNLVTYYSTKRGPVRAVEGVSFRVEKGQSIGLVGESGCGKTTVALSIMRILPSRGKVVGGKILWKGVDLVNFREKQMREVRWKEISIVFQGAMNALDPLYKLGDQISEAIKIHESRVSKTDLMKRTGELLGLVGLEPVRASSYPHELSGGMRQRGLIAMALACRPELLIADEPGTALDVIVQAQILSVMEDLRKRLNLGMILITHDLSTVADTCDKVVIMYAGKIAEHADVLELFEKPLHPYTQGLIRAFPSIRSARTRMTSIPGSPPDLLDPPKGCRFHPRCTYAKPICKQVEPVLTEKGGKEHFVACHLYDDA
jgi:peptide/nickel transport system ATP-binding protein